MNEPIRMVADGEARLVTQTTSFEAFFIRQRDPLFGALCLITHDREEAEELTQEAFVAVLERWERIAAMENPTGYLYRTAMNMFRKRYRRGLLAARRTLHVAAPADPLADVEERDTTVRALAKLTPRQRAAVVLTDLLGYPSEEAARMLGIRPSTLRMHASVGRAALRDRMGADDG
jgi:RNA polymerase sigma factor (sigma-70 family)